MIILTNAKTTLMTYSLKNNYIYPYSNRLTQFMIIINFLSFQRNRKKEDKKRERRGRKIKNIKPNHATTTITKDPVNMVKLAYTSTGKNLSYLNFSKNMKNSKIMSNKEKQIFLKVNMVFQKR